MSVLRLKVNKTPNEDVAFTNRAIFNPNNLDVNAVKYVKVTVNSGRHYFFSTASNLEINEGQIGLSVSQRRWANISLLEDVEVSPFFFSATNPVISSIILLVDFNTPKKATNIEPLDSDKMSHEFSMQFSNMVFTKDQELLFRYYQNAKAHILKIIVKSMQGVSVNSKNQEEIKFGILSSNASIVFDKVEGSILNLIGKSKGKLVQRSIINPEFDFQKLGIGGLDREFSDIFRRAFSSRVFPSEYIEQLGMKHVRGILLYGPPGTGKTLIARQIGKMLNAREPKVVNGPEILNKFVGESEANMRKLFADAEEEWKRCGANSGLHMIIFDEIDAICKQRGSIAGSSGVHDTVVNQLLTKLDGVEQLNNILVIGMTNRKDMIDEALLRPGRIEVQLEISLPDEVGRLQILRIHTARMKEYKKLDPNVDLAELAKKTKNFSGAEIEGLVRAAQSSAMNRLIKVSGKVQVDDDALDKFLVTYDDFIYALENDIKPAFGLNEETLSKLLYGDLICWSNSVSEILEKGELLVRETASSETCGFVRALLTGSRNSGKTFLAALIAKRSEFPFIKVCSPGDMIGFSETAKCAQLRKIFDDAYRSPFSCIIIDNIERLLDFSPVGMRYSNLVLQALLVLLGQRPPINRRLLVLCTTSCEHFLREVDLIDSFSNLIHVPLLKRPEHIITVLEETNAFSDKEINEISHELYKPGFNLAIGIKRLLELIDFVKQGKDGFRTRLLLDQLSSMALGIA